MKKILIIIYVITGSVFANNSCLEGYFCGSSYKNKELAKADLVNSISTNVKVSFIKENNLDNKRVYFNTKQESELPFPELNCIIDQKTGLIKYTIKKERYFKYLKNYLKVLSKRNNIDLYNNLAGIYNFYHKEKISYITHDDNKYFYIKNFSKNNLIDILIKKNLEDRGYFFKEKVIDNETIVVNIKNETTYIIKDYRNIIYKLKYKINIGNNNKKDILIEKDFLARSKDNFKDQRNEYLKFLFKSDI